MILQSRQVHFIFWQISLQIFFNVRKGRAWPWNPVHNFLPGYAKPKTRTNVTSSDIWWSWQLSTNLGEGIIFGFYWTSTRANQNPRFQWLSFLCSDLLFKRILLTSYGAVVLYKSTEWDGTPKPWYPIIVNFSTNFYICTSGAISKINESAQK